MMEQFFSIMMVPLLACLILTGIHAYLGLHVIERQVIFVDLALAQIAALGASLALLVGHDMHSAASYRVSLGFTIVAAGIFSSSRFREQRIPQEAIIGITYAVSAALLIMVHSHCGEGDEHIRQSLIGNILLVRPAEVIKIAVIYAFVGLFHFLCRDKFFLISRSSAEALSKGVNVRLWDFLFYASFGLVVTSSVKIAGVLLVFSFLVVPAACAVLFSSGLKTRLMLGWLIGLLASVGGMAASYFLDFPTGASVVCVFGFILLVLASIKRGLMVK